MKSSTTHLWLASSAVMVLLAMAGTSFAQSPENLGKRLTLIERKLDNAALGEMANQLEALHQQVQNLRGEIEQVQRQLREVNERQRNIYSDVDSRLRALEQGTTEPQNQNPPSSSTRSPSGDKQAPGAESISPSEAANSNAPPNGGAAQEENQASDGGKAADRNAGSVDSTGEYAAYERAFNTLREGQYAKSQQEFREFLRRYPSSQYADNARYWLGESYYVGRHFDQAMEQFQKLLDNFPDSAKRSGAQLKIGFIQYEQGKLDQARKTLGEVMQHYPKSTAANLAEQRLRLIDNGH